MITKLFNKVFFGCLIHFFASSFQLSAQSHIPLTKRLLLRDSLDYKRIQIGINSKFNEFSPIPYKGGLLFVSDRPIGSENISFNKVYWVADTNLDGLNQWNTKKEIRFSANNNLVFSSVNDNNLLFNYNKLKKASNFNPIEKEFATVSMDQSFAYNELSRELIYAKYSTKRFNGIKRWELWQAELKNGKLIKKKKIIFNNRNADYLYPYLSESGTRLYFASNMPGTQGGYDLFYMNKGSNGWGAPIALNKINTKDDDLAPFISNDSLYFSSNRDGGLGGYDIYGTSLKNLHTTRNLGFGVNSESDELGFKKVNDNYFLTTNRFGNFDIIGFSYLPVTISIDGQIVYASDETLASNKKILLRDIDQNVIVDSFYSDYQAKYRFYGKPNRSYELVTTNEEGDKEIFAIQTSSNLIQTELKVSSRLNGKSLKQIKDSLDYIVYSGSKQYKDSILASIYGSKFIVHYGFDKSIIEPKEFPVLDSLLLKLKKTPNAVIVIGAFTDCIGSYKYNYNLSVRRANSVIAYLLKHGLDKNKIVSNGYSKKYTITPCATNYNKTSQVDNRRAEIVLNDNKLNDWASLENIRGRKYYSEYDSKSKNVINLSKVIDRETRSYQKNVNENNSITRNQITKIDSPRLNVALPKYINNTPARKMQDTVSNKNNLISSATVNGYKKADNNIMINNPKPNKLIQPALIIANTSDMKENEISKEDIIAALDSLAKLKVEQERIVEYLTKRINKKPIEVLVSSDSVFIEIYDNGIHDKDSVSVIYNNRIVVDRKELKVNLPIKFAIKIDKQKKYNELILVAENLGSEPPNTGVMFVTEKSGKRQQIMLSTDMLHNEVVYFIKISKE
jgi:outer membrane protein OmpA-like peptidoglycan-associated protein